MNAIAKAVAGSWQQPRVRGRLRSYCLSILGSAPRVLHRLLREFVRSHVIFLVGVRHRNAMGVRGQFVEFRRPLM